jgi:hypothetical protein
MWVKFADQLAQEKLICFIISSPKSNLEQTQTRLSCDGISIDEDCKKKYAFDEKAAAFN